MNRTIKNLNTFIPACAVSVFLIGCGDSGKDGHGHGHEHPPETDARGHKHSEFPLGTIDFGGMSVEASQGHGKVEAGKESHLVIKLPYSDNGETIVRAWIGVEDRTFSSVGKGEYSAERDSYDIHAAAPDPLVQSASWWLEVEKPDGGKTVASFPWR